MDVLSKIIDQLKRNVKFYSEMLEDEYKNVEIGEELNADEKVLMQFGYLMAYKDLSLWLEHEFPADINDSDLYKQVVQESKKLISVGQNWAAISKSGDYSKQYREKLRWLGTIAGFKDLISSCETSMDP